MKWEHHHLGFFRGLTCPSSLSVRTHAQDSHQCDNVADRGGSRNVASTSHHQDGLGAASWCPASAAKGAGVSLPIAPLRDQGGGSGWERLIYSRLFLQRASEPAMADGGQQLDGPLQMTTHGDIHSTCSSRPFSNVGGLAGWGSLHAPDRLAAECLASFSSLHVLPARPIANNRTAGNMGVQTRMRTTATSGQFQRSR